MSWQPSWHTPNQTGHKPEYTGHYPYNPNQDGIKFSRRPTGYIFMCFTNLKGDFRKPETSRVLRWMLGLHKEKRPKAPGTGVPVPFVHNDGKQLRKGNKDTLTWIGQASFLVQLAGKNVLIDPVLSMNIGWVRRNSPPGIVWPAMPKIDLVLITHSHRDHMDAPSLKKLGADPVYLVPSPS